MMNLDFKSESGNSFVGLLMMLALGGGALGVGSYLSQEWDGVLKAQKSIKLDKARSVGTRFNLSALAIAQAALKPKSGGTAPISIDGINFVGNDTGRIQVLDGELKVKHDYARLRGKDLDFLFSNGSSINGKKQFLTTSIAPVRQTTVGNEIFVFAYAQTRIKIGNSEPRVIKQLARLVISSPTMPAGQNGTGNNINLAANSGNTNSASTSGPSNMNSGGPCGNLSPGNSSSSASASNGNASGNASGSAQGDMTASDSNVVITDNGVSSSSCSVAVSNGGSASASAGGSSSAGGSRR